jgi:hypothetical protein
MTDPVYRPCGTCNACCIWLGIEPLRKWPGQTCKHLDAIVPDKQCKIYDKRPHCCVTYSCGWRSGLGPDAGYRPDQSGILVTLHPSPDDDTAFTGTVHVIDLKLAGTIDDPDSKLTEVLGALLSICQDVRVIKSGEKAGSNVIHFYKGAVYGGVILPPEKGKFEDLNFAEEQQPIGHYHVKPASELTADDKAKIARFRQEMRR